MGPTGLKQRAISSCRWMDTEDRERVEPQDCESIVRHRRLQFTPSLGQGQRRFDFELTDGLHFPPAAYTEWSAILQNVLLNAANATLDQNEPRIRITSALRNRYGLLQVSDNGVGIGENPDEYFKPFARKSKISSERRELGMGGAGLGLTIVEMISENRNCDVAFVAPDDPQWSTTFELSWRVER